MKKIVTLLVTLVIVFLMSNNALAKFSEEKGIDINGDVASWDVSVESTKISIPSGELFPGATYEFSIELTNDGDVAVDVTAEVAGAPAWLNVDIVVPNLDSRDSVDAIVTLSIDESETILIAGEAIDFTITFTFSQP